MEQYPNTNFETIAPQQSKLPSRTWTTKFVITIIVILVLAGVAFGSIWYWQQNQVLNEIVTTFTPRPSVVSCSPSSVMAKQTTYSTDLIIGGAKIFKNNVYGYSFSYPTNWFIDNTYANDTFTPRGPDNKCVGGDLYIVNYKGDFSVASGNVAPKDLDEVYLSIYEVQPGQTINQFINSFFKYYTTVNTTNFNLGGISAMKVVATAPDDAGKSMTQSWALAKKNNQIFLFALGDEAHQAVYNQVLSSFRFTQ